MALPRDPELVMRDACIRVMVDNELAPAKATQRTIKKKQAICAACTSSGRNGTRPRETVATPGIKNNRN